MANVLKGIMKALLIIIVIMTLIGVYQAYKTSLDVIDGRDPYAYQQLQDPENQMAIIKYGRKAMAFVMNSARPVLKEMGIEVEGTYSEDSDEITRHAENAKAAMDSALDELFPTR